MAMLSAFSLILALYAVKCIEYTSEGCTSTTRTQSPQSLFYLESTFYEETNFRIFHNDYKEIDTDTKWSLFTEDSSFGIKADFPDESDEDKSFGSILFMKDWALYRFNLTRIIFRLPGEHMVDGQNFDLEVQLEHDLDLSYNNPGKRIDLGVSKLVIAFPFKQTEDYDPQQTQLFSRMGIKDFLDTPAEATLDKKIKLKHLVQHQPMYFYKGGLSYGNCDPAAWLVASHFHLVSKQQVEWMKNILTTNNFSKQGLLHGKTINGNARTFPATFTQTKPKVYRNFQQRELMNPTLNYFHYNTAVFYSLSLALLGIFFLI